MLYIKKIQHKFLQLVNFRACPFYFFVRFVKYYNEMSSSIAAQKQSDLGSY